MIKTEYLEGLLRARQIAEATGKGKTAALAITEEINRFVFEDIVQRTISGNTSSEEEVLKRCEERFVRSHDADAEQKAYNEARSKFARNLEFVRNMEIQQAENEKIVPEIWGRPGEFTIVDHPEDGIYRIPKKWFKKIPFLKWLSL